MCASSMVLPAPAQIGVVVKNLDNAMNHYSQVFGVGPFQVIEFAPAQHWLKGKPTPIRLNIGIAQWGNLQLELIEVVEGGVSTLLGGMAAHHVAKALAAERAKGVLLRGAAAAASGTEVPS